MSGSLGALKETKAAVEGRLGLERQLVAEASDAAGSRDASRIKSWLDRAQTLGMLGAREADEVQRAGERLSIESSIEAALTAAAEASDVEGLTAALAKAAGAGLSEAASTMVRTARAERDRLQERRTAEEYLALALASESLEMIEAAMVRCPEVAPRSTHPVLLTPIPSLLSPGPRRRARRRPGVHADARGPREARAARGHRLGQRAARGGLAQPRPPVARRSPRGAARARARRGQVGGGGVRGGDATANP